MSNVLSITQCFSFNILWYTFSLCKSTATTNSLLMKWKLARIAWLSISGSVVEWSKALVEGTSLFGGVGSNPTAAKFPFFIISSLIKYTIQYSNVFVFSYCPLFLRLLKLDQEYSTNMEVHLFIRMCLFCYLFCLRQFVLLDGFYTTFVTNDLLEPYSLLTNCSFTLCLSYL